MYNGEILCSALIREYYLVNGNPTSTLNQGATVIVKVSRF